MRLEVALLRDGNTIPAAAGALDMGWSHRFPLVAHADVIRSVLQSASPEWYRPPRRGSGQPVGRMPPTHAADACAIGQPIVVNGCMDAAAIEAARNELRDKTKEQIEWDTANKWCARGLAAYEFFAATGDLHWLSAAIAYHGEAVEHAAHASHEHLVSIEQTLDQAQSAAFRHA